MCGIAGILDWRGAGHAPQQCELETMIAQLYHRGPDGYGYFLNAPIGLAHARLSIVDITGGDQPIFNEDRSIAVVFNGEIFNYVELRNELQLRGHHFYTKSDTEVIVHAYEEYGDDFVQRLNGQFAIALWDNNARRLLLVRDRVGITPLFYTRVAGRFVFASEIKALLPIFPSKPVLNPAALDQIFTFWAPLGSHSLFDKVQALEPGTLLIADREGERIQHYWDWKFPQHPDEFWQGSEEQLADQLRDLLIDATQIRLRADVQVGAYLSGGLDSSVIAGLIHHHSRTPLRTFSIGFEEKSFDESSFQRQMVDHLHADHSHVVCSNRDVGDLLPDTIWHTETTILRTAPVPMRRLSALVRQQGFKVVLTGEGADEVLGGYDIFKEAKIRQFWARQPQSEWRPLLLKKLYPYLDISSNRSQIYLQNFYGIGLDEPDSPLFAHLPRCYTTTRAKIFFSDDLQQQLRSQAMADLKTSMPAGVGRWAPLNRAQYIEAKVLMGNYLLCSQGDRMLMANSVEGRFPFLDHRVIEFASRLPPSLKIKVLNEKYLLKQATKCYLPAAISARHKQPYRAPDAPSFIDQVTGKLLPYVSTLLSDETLRDYGYFDEKRVGLLMKKVLRGGATSYKDNQAVVGILTTQLWHHMFVQGSSVN